MLGREILKPIDKNRLKEILKMLWDYFPNEIRLSSDETITKKQLLRPKEDRDSGFICKVDNKTRFIFKQQSTGPGTQELLTEIHPDDYAKLIESLPENEHKIFLQCLNLHTNFAALLENEKADIANNPAEPLQKQKHLSKNSAEHDLPFLQRNQGTVYLQSHLHVESWQLMCERMPLFKRENIKVLYLELPCTLMGPLFKHFNKSGDTKLLQEHLELFPMGLPERIPYFIALCRLAYMHGIEVFPIDTSAALLMPHEANTPKQLQNNSYPDQYMRTQIVKHQRAGGAKKFVGLLGALHDNVAHELKIPTIIFVPDPDVVSLNPKVISSKELLQQMLSLRDCGNLTLELYSTYKQTEKKACCSSSTLKRVGFFTAATAVAVTAVTYALTM